MKKVKPAMMIEDEDLKKKIIHPPEKEDELFNSKLPVYAPYVINELNGIHFIVASDLKKFQVGQQDFSVEEFKEQFKPSIINPFTEENLLTDIGNINIQDIESVLSFCNRYGLYGERVKNYVPLSLLESPLKIEVKDEVFKNLSESYDYFLEQTFTIQFVLKIIKDEIPQLEKKFEETNQQDIHEELMLNKRAIKRIVNRGLRFVSPGLNLEDDEFLPSYTSQTLLGAAYYQLYEAISNRKQFRECKFCRSLFIPRSPHGKYCPPVGLESHGSCENTYNQMKFKARRAVKSGKKTIEEVANSIGRPLDEVKEWFN